MRRNGIWASPSQFVELPRRVRLGDEIATRQRSLDAFGLGLALPDPDPVLRKLGQDIRVYRELLADPRVGSCAESRQNAVTALEWKIDRGKAKARVAAFVEGLFGELDIYGLLAEFDNAPFFGMQPAEIIWTRDGARTVPERITGKPVEWFVFDPENRLRLRTRENMTPGELLPERKFVMARNRPSYDNPYGVRVLSRVFWSVVFKRGGVEFWVTFVEKYGMDYPIGRVPRGAEQKEIDDLLDALERMVADGVAVIPDDSSIEFKSPPGRAASAQLYQGLKQAMDTDIAIAILGQNLTTEVKGGSLAAAEAHMGVRRDIRDADKRIYEAALDQLIAWIVEINFGSGEACPKFILFEKEEVDQALATRDATLIGTGRAPLSRKYLMRAYGFEDGDFDAADNKGGLAPEAGPAGADAGPDAPAGFAEPGRPGLGAYPDQEALDAAMAAITPEALQAAADPLLAPVLDLIREAASLEEIVQRLHEAWPDMDGTAFEGLLTRAIFVADVWGRISARSEGKE